MRNDPTKPTGDRDAMGLVAVLTGYASLAIIFACIIALLVAGHRYSTDRQKAVQAAEADYFGIEELVDLLVVEPGIPSDVLSWPKPRSFARVMLDPKDRR